MGTKTVPTLHGYRKFSIVGSTALIPVHIEPPTSEPEVATIVFTHVHGHRLELPVSVSANWVAVDMRRGLDDLSAIVQQNLGHSPCAGSAFIFRNRAGNRLQLLLWDGNGVWLCQRRLHQGAFVWPKVKDAVFAISLAQWQWLIAGVDWQRLSAKSSAHWRV